jgi:hypothetical protein
MSLFVASLVFACGFAVVEYLAPRMPQGNPNYGIALGLVFGVLSFANLFLGAGISFWSKDAFGQRLAGCCVLPMLFALANTDKLLPSFFYWDPSGRALSDGLHRQAIPSDALYVSKNMNRGLHYSLNFYLRREIPDWDAGNPRQGYLLTGAKRYKSQIGSDYALEEIPFDPRKTGYFLYRVLPESADGPARSGQPQ